ncbi:MAG TPA: alpha/beta hydrolase [Acidiphilium sp.]|nr:MAG: alpha/beta hydrolase [Acidiphilium sp. 21-60-14]OYV89338.1 MAG: alpha/beta hydrolase [Acidiphilium sp. 37-60-79]HQT88703.1 alpha/beta hydrolase [Acidiphilium sp.]HQU25083.1 alpha/beta hydrolase [Acidiphilium sp.]
MTDGAGRAISLMVAGRRIAARLWGQIGAGPTIVLLHEGLGSISMWRDFPQALAQVTGCAVFAYDRIGYGQSDIGTLPWPLDYMTIEALEVLPAILQAAGIERVILVGHSDGASIALIHAGGMQNFGLRGLVLIAPHLFVEDVSIKSIEAVREAFRSGDLRARLARHHDDPDHAFWGWNGAWLDSGFRDWRIDGYVPTVRVPILAIQGDADEYGTPAQLAPLEQDAYCPVDVQLVAGARHAPHLSHRAEILALVAPFVARICRMESV